MSKNFGFKDIVLQHRQSVLSSRKDAIIGVNVKNKWLESPVVLSNMPSCQNDEVLNIFNNKKWPYIYHRVNGQKDILQFATRINEQNWFLKSISVGVKPEDWELLKTIKTLGLQIDWLTIDVALIYNANFEEYIKNVRALFPNSYLIAGNFSNSECVKWLRDKGVDCCKFGIGVSELCRTRQYTGFGSTLSDFVECIEASTKLPDEPDFMLDGGLTILDEEKGEIAYGDVFKALNLGAKWVMSSSLFRWAHELSIGDKVIQYGNSTARAKNHNKHVEGAVKTFNSQYHLEDQMRKIKEHLRSSVSYAGLTDIQKSYNSCIMKIIS
jgi:GMP reductase